MALSDQSGNATKDHYVPENELSQLKVETSAGFMLDRLIELESLLEQDVARKANRQKPKLQQAWLAEIKQINTQLKLN